MIPVFLRGVSLEREDRISVNAVFVVRPEEVYFLLFR